jgi:hypothetical protein
MRTCIVWQVFTFQTCCRQKFACVVVLYQHRRMPFWHIHVIRHCWTFTFVSCDRGEETTEYKWAGNVYFCEEVVSDGSPLELVSPSEEFKIGFDYEYPHRLYVGGRRRVTGSIWIWLSQFLPSPPPFGIPDCCYCSPSRVRSSK